MADTARGESLLGSLARVLLPTAVFAYIFALTLSLALNDPDLWWHLRTAEHMAQTHSLPAYDPFSYTITKPLSHEVRQGMASQWLGQLAIYAPYRLGGLLGVVLLRNLLILLPMGIVVVWLFRKGAGAAHMIALAGFPLMVFAFEEFTAFERPQAFSLVLTLLLVMSMERLRAGGARARPGHDVSHLAPIAIMALWSNLHSGYLIGCLIIGVYMAAEGAKILWRRKMTKAAPSPTAWMFFAVTGAALIASGLNPAGYSVALRYAGAILPSIGQAAQGTGAGFVGGGSNWTPNMVLEYMPLMYFYSDLGRKWLLLYAAFAGTLFIVLGLRYWRARSIDMAELAVASIILVLSYRHARFYMFALAIMPFYIGRAVIEAQGTEFRDRLLRGVSLGLLLMISLGFLYHMIDAKPFLLRPKVTGRWVSPMYPSGLTEFIKERGVSGPLYNYYGWGGFFIWALYPDYKVFVDGRALDEGVLKDADTIANAAAGWERLLDSYGVNAIAIPVVAKETGNVVPLSVELVKAPGWRLVYLRENAALFVRASVADKDLIHSYNTDKTLVLDEILRIEGIMLGFNPGHRAFELGRALALYEKGRYAEAGEIYERYPGHDGGRLSVIRAKSR